MSVFNANSVDPDQMPHSAVSDLGLIWVYTVCHCPFYGILGINGLKPVEKYSLPVSSIITSLRTVKKTSTRLRTVVSKTVLYCLSIENHISGKLG